MPLTGPEIGRLSRILEDAFIRSELERLLEQVDQPLAQFPDGGTPRVFIDEVVRTASRREWYEALLFRAINARPEVRELRAFVNLRVARPGGPFPKNYWPLNEFKTCFVGENDPFVDRNNLREEVEGMLSGSPTRILRIEGPPGIGKTYATEYIRTIQRTKGGFDLAYVKLDAFTPKIRGCTVRNLVTEICGQVSGLHDLVFGTSGIGPSDNHAQSTGKATTLIKKLKEGLLSRERELWLVLDGFKGVKLPLETEEAIHTLMEWTRVTESRNVRLVLVDAGDHLELSALDPLQLGPLQQSDVEMFFKRLFTDRQEEFPELGLQMAVGFVEQELEEGYSIPEVVRDALLSALGRLGVLAEAEADHGN